MSQTLGLQDLKYEYESNGNLASRSHSFGLVTQGGTSYKEEYGYDSLNRLTDRTVLNTTDASAGFSMDASRSSNLHACSLNDSLS